MNHLELLERKTRLWHIEQAAYEIVTFTAGKTPKDYETDVVLRYAIERQLITIGEALTRALRVDPELAHHISETPQIVSFRNQLVHNYPGIDAAQVWDIITTDLPVLLREVRTLLAS
jgi:uncharacterized protein with HEPN domain